MPRNWSAMTVTGRLALVMFFSNLYLYLPVLPLYLQRQGLDFVQINSLWGIIVGTTFLSEVPTGMIADRLGRSRSVQIALGLQLLGEIIFLFAPNYWLFVAAAVAGGLGFAFASGSVEALLYDALLARGAAEEMSRAMGTIAAAKRTANLIAFGMAGFVFATLDPALFRPAIALTAAMVGVGWLLTFTLHDTGASHTADAANARSNLLGDSVAALRTNRRLLGLAVLALVTTPFADYLLKFFPVHFVEMNVPAMWLGWALAIASAIGITGARYAYRLEARSGIAASLLMVTLAPGLGYLALAIVGQPIATVIIFCLLYGSMSLRDPILSGQLNLHIVSHYRATLLSTLNMATGLYVALMGLALGWIADRSLTLAFAAMGAIIIAGSLLFRVAPPQQNDRAAQQDSRS